MNLEEKTVHIQPIFTGKVISLQVEDVILPNGNISKREVVKHPGAVAVIAQTKEKKIILVEQYRKALERTIIEIPAGKLELNEKPDTCAIRELEEETGYRCDSVKQIQKFYTSPGFADELIYIFEAANVKKVENGLAKDEDEFVHLLEVSLEEAEKLIAEEKIIDAKTVFAINYLKMKNQF